MTEQQRYDVLERFDAIEVRRYPACTVADVVVPGTVEQAGNAAFRPLVSYISGNNVARARMAMTAPVVQEVAGEKLAMTAPVLQQETAPGLWTVSFVLPGARPRISYPDPVDPQVSLREVPEHTAAVLRWSGRWTARNVAERTEQLLAALQETSWIPVGEPRWARYDPPWRPPFVRRNEIVVTVEESG